MEAVDTDKGEGGMLVHQGIMALMQAHIMVHQGRLHLAGVVMDLLEVVVVAAAVLEDMLDIKLSGDMVCHQECLAHHLHHRLRTVPMLIPIIIRAAIVLEIATILLSLPVPLQLARILKMMGRTR